MPCVRNLSVQHALEYFKDDIQKKEAKGFDYYSQEDSGVWFGKTAERLGFIDKKFSEKDYKGVMEGKFSYFDTNTRKTVNVDLTKNSKNKEHHAGIEITLSAPKSVSIMAEVFKDNRVRDVHTMALNNVMEYIQNNLVYTRSSKDGKMQLEKVDNLLAIKFTHHTSRNHDPQLHTHILVANIIIDKHGKVKTAEHTSIFECERFIRELYYNELANNLIQLGYEVEWQKKVTQMAPEIKGIPKEFNDFFSTRRKEIEEFAKQNNISLEDAETLNIISLFTRKAKDSSIGIDELSPVWNNLLEKLGINIEQFKAEMYQNNLKNLEQLRTANMQSLNQAVNNSINHLTERKSTFTKEELVSCIIDRTNGIYGIKQIEKAINNNKELVDNNLELEKYSKHLGIFSNREKIIFTTKTQIELEDKILSFIESGKNKFKSVIEINNLVKNNNLKNTAKINSINNLLFSDNIKTNDKINSKTYSTLNSNQRMTVDFILNNKDQFLAIQGYAGVGKTYTIKALNEILKENNIELIGLTPTHSASNTLKNEANIKTETLQNFLAKYNGYANDRELNKNSLKDFKKIFSNKIILVDESSLISNKQMKELTTIANKFNVRVILQGDQKQLDSVESGTPFHRLIDGKYIQYSELNNILRQRDETIKQAVYDIIGKNIKNSFQKLKDSNHIIELRTNEQLDSKGLKDNLYKFNEKTNKTELNQEIYNKFLNFLENSNIDKIKTDLIHSAVKTYNNLAKEEKDNTIIITSSNEIRKEINKEIRKNIKLDNEKSGINNELKSISVETLELKSLTSQEKKEIENYNINDSITFLKNNNKLNIKKDVEYNIVNVNKNTNEIILEVKEDNKQHITINIQKQFNNLNLYSKESKELIINDKIRFTTAHKEIGIYKNSNFVVKDINKTENIITLIDNDKQKQELKLDLNKNTEKKLIKHIDYDYTTTTYSSQGKTSHNVIYTLESYRPILTTQKDFYVGLSRAKDNITIITDNIDKSISALIGNTGEKIGAKDVEIEDSNNKTNKTLNNDLTLNNVNNEINKDNIDMEV